MSKKLKHARYIERIIVKVREGAEGIGVLLGG